MIEIALIGRGGQGIVTAASILADAALEEGKYPQKMATYGAARRGDLVRASVRIDTAPVRPRTPVDMADVLVIADATLPLARFEACLRPSGTLIACGTGLPVTDAAVVCIVDAPAVSRDVFGNLPIPLAGIIMLGALLKGTAVVGFESVEKVLGSHVAAPFLEKNKRALRQGFDRALYSAREAPRIVERETEARGWDSAGLQPYTLLPPGPVFRPSDLPDILTGAWRSHRPVIEPGLCRACGRCASACPEGVLREGPEGMTIDYDHCKGCGICVKQCPRRAVTMTEEHV